MLYIGSGIGSGIVMKLAYCVFFLEMTAKFMETSAKTGYNIGE